MIVTVIENFEDQDSVEVRKGQRGTVEHILDNGWLQVIFRDTGYISKVHQKDFGKLKFAAALVAKPTYYVVD